MTTTPTEQADPTAAQVAALVALLRAGQVDRTQFVQFFAALVYAAKVRAAALAEALLFRLYGWTPLGIEPRADALPALQKAAQTLTEDMPESVPEDVPDEPAEDREQRPEVVLSFWSGVESSAQRVASDAVTETGRETKQTRMRREGVTHWTWVAEVDACDECRERDGKVFPISVRFVKTHPRCGCDIEPAEGEARQPLGFENLTGDQLWSQLAALEPLRDTEYRNKQVQRIRARIAELEAS